MRGRIDRTEIDRCRLPLERTILMGGSSLSDLYHLGRTSADFQ